LGNRRPSDWFRLVLLLVARGRNLLPTRFTHTKTKSINSPCPWFRTGCTEPWTDCMEHHQGLGPSRTAPAGSDSAVRGRRSREGIGAMEVEQGFRQRLELLQRQGPDGGAAGLAQGAAAAGELGEGEGDFAFLAALRAQSVRSRRIFLARTSLISRCLGTG